MQETEGNFASVAEPNEVFLVDHVEERVALGAVLRRCTLLPQAPRGGRASAHTYICRFQLVATEMGPALMPVGAGR